MSGRVDEVGESAPRSFVIIGGGPAGLTAAYELAKLDKTPTVLEQGSMVGGLARTENYKGFHFDMGGHRFFTKSAEVNRLWGEILADDFLRRPRLSRIYYQNKFFHYPLKPLDALWKLGPLETILIILSYLRWQLFPYRPEDTFEQWVTNRFGKRLFETFFKTYTEKVWGIPCSELKAEWAAQRIKNLSVKAILVSFLLKSKETITTLIEEFQYPRLGPGMMWKAVQERVETRGGTVRLNNEVVRILREDNRVTGVQVSNNGRAETISGTDFISSMPVTEFIKKLDPPPPAEVQEAAHGLRYRDFLTVCLIIDKPHLFADNWIYIHEPSVKVGRIQNFKNWSPEMVPDPAKTSLGLEYFCNKGDSLWSMADSELVELGKRELDRIGLARYGDVEDGCVFRVPNSYPVYDSGYRAHLDVIRQFMDGLANCQTVGRNGLHRYNNQDHSMLTGIYAVRNLLYRENHDLWEINADEEYHEEIREQVVETVLAKVFEKVDPVAAGVSSGLLCGSLLFLATLMLVLKGGPVVGPNLSLLQQYFPGYSVTVVGSLIGLVYGCLMGFLAGGAFARAGNMATLLYMAIIRRRMTLSALRGVLDEI